MTALFKGKIPAEKLGLNIELKSRDTGNKMLSEEIDLLEELRAYLKIDPPLDAVELQKMYIHLSQELSEFSFKKVVGITHTEDDEVIFLRIGEIPVSYGDTPFSFDLLRTAEGYKIRISSETPFFAKINEDIFGSSQSGDTAGWERVETKDALPITPPFPKEK